MSIPSPRTHIPMAFLEAIWKEFDAITWAPDERPARIRLLYSSAISNAVKAFYATSEGVEEGAARLPDHPSPSPTGDDNV